MSVNVTPHLNFRGQARAALEFYQSVFGGDLVAIKYADAHTVTAAEEADQLMWGQVVSEAGFRIMAHDVPSQTPWEPGTIPFFVSVRGTDTDEISGVLEQTRRRCDHYRATGSSTMGTALWHAHRSIRRDLGPRHRSKVERFLIQSLDS